MTRHLARSRRRTVTARAGALAALLLLVGFLSGCSGANDAGGGGGGEAGSVAAEDGGGDEEAAARDVDAADDTLEEAAPRRAIVRTAEVQIRTDDPAGARDDLDRLLRAWGGFVADEETYVGDEGEVQGSYLQVRVPADRYQDLLDELADLGEVLGVQQHAEDVTEAIVDVSSRIRTHRVSLARLRTLMTSAENVNALVRIESEITEREAELESLLARRANLAGRVAMARVTVDLSAPGAPEAGPLDDAGFLAGLESGWKALGDVAVVAATALGASLPFLAALAVVLVPLALWMRSSRRRRTPPALPDPEPEA
jgi:hypothetical protein